LNFNLTQACRMPTLEYERLGEAASASVARNALQNGFAGCHAVTGGKPRSAFGLGEGAEKRVALPVPATPLGNSKRCQCPLCLSIRSPHLRRRRGRFLEVCVRDECIREASPRSEDANDPSANRHALLPSTGSAAVAPAGLIEIFLALASPGWFLRWVSSGCEGRLQELSQKATARRVF